MTIATITAPTVTGDPHVTTATEMNTALASIASKLNETIGIVNGIVNPSAPDLSGYVTTGTLASHKTSFDHQGSLRLDTGPAARKCVLQTKTGTLVAGTATVTWDTSYATGSIVAAWAVSTMTTANAVSVSAFTATGATVKGTGTDTFVAVAVGWI